MLNRCSRCGSYYNPTSLDVHHCNFRVGEHREQEDERSDRRISKLEKEIAKLKSKKK